MPSHSTDVTSVNSMLTWNLLMTFLLRGCDRQGGDLGTEEKLTEAHAAPASPALRPCIPSMSPTQGQHAAIKLRRLPCPGHQRLSRWTCEGGGSCPAPCWPGGSHRPRRAWHLPRPRSDAAQHRFGATPPAGGGWHVGGYSAGGLRGPFLRFPRERSALHVGRRFPAGTNDGTPFRRAVQGA